MATPEDSVQFLIQPWWEKTDKPSLTRGRLVKTLVRFPDQDPYVLDPAARSEDPADHGKGIVTIEPFRPHKDKKAKDLPLAGLPEWPGQRFVFSRGKCRPPLVLTDEAPAFPRDVAKGMPSYQRAPTVLVAPYYGGDRDGTRAGYPDALLERIRRAEYPHVAWDSLPLADVAESVLRLDHTFPMGTSPSSYELYPFILSQQAMDLLDSWIEWFLSGNPTPPDGSTLAVIRNLLAT